MHASPLTFKMAAMPFEGPITAIFNASIQKSYIPTKWKQAIISPIPKKLPPPNITKDIRPISLTSLLAKQGHPMDLFLKISVLLESPAG